MLVAETCAQTIRNDYAQLVTLSRRDLQIAELVSQGEQNKEIAASLGIGENTVKVYLSTLLRKLGLPNRAALSAWAVTHAAAIAHALRPEDPELEMPGVRSRSRFRRLYVSV